MKASIFDFLLFLKLFLIFVGVRAQTDQSPNVLVIYTDDHRYTGVKALGGQEIETPHMDAMVNNGVAFTNAYLMGAFSGATCVPSRAMLLTGRNLFQLEGKGHVIPKEHKTIGEVFQAEGYHTHIVGKWHQDKKSLKRSFDSGDKVMGLGVYLRDHFRMPLWDWDSMGEFKREDAYLLSKNKQDVFDKRSIDKNDKKGPFGTEKDGPHTSEIFANSAVDYIKTHKKDKPFFMYLAFHAPHDPRQAPKEYVDKYPYQNVVLPPSYMRYHPFDNGHMVLRDEELAPWPRTKQIAQQHLASYYSIISHLDTQIGKVIEALKTTDTYKNTLIVFAGDSGLAVGNHGLMGKQNIYDEDGIHVPLVFSGGVIKDHGRKVDAYTYIHDIFPTICDLAKVPIPNSITGKSVAPILSGEKKEHRSYTYHAYKQFQRAYRKGEYKLIEYVRANEYSKTKGIFERGSRVTQLFNFKEDPWETQDLSFFPKYQELIQQMRKEMKEKSIELGDKKENVSGEQFDFWDNYDLIKKTD